MRTRRKERRQALELLYEWDQRRTPLQEIIDTKREGGLSARFGEFCLALVEGTLSHLPEIDAIIEQYSEDWKLERMPVVDRNILRLGVYELLYGKGVPVAVTINECVELAKWYGSDDSRRFINGLLGKVAREHRNVEAETKASKEASDREEKSAKRRSRKP